MTKTKYHDIGMKNKPSFCKTRMDFPMICFGVKEPHPVIPRPLNPFRAPKILPILIPSNFVLKNGFLAAEALK